MVTPELSKSADADRRVRAALTNVEARETEHLSFLKEAFRVSCSGLAEFQSWIGEELAGQGMLVEEFIVPASELDGQPSMRKTLREQSVVLRQGLNIVGRIGDGEPSSGLLIYGHADKTPESYELTRDNAEAMERDGRIHGPGIADDVAGIAAMLSAVKTVTMNAGTMRAGCLERPLFCASILGKQLGVMGTFGLMKRYGPIAESIYVHPAESGDGLHEVHITSNGLAEFAIDIASKPPDTRDPFHPIYDRGSLNAADFAADLTVSLRTWAAKAALRFSYPPLDAETGKSLGLLISNIQTTGGNPIYQLPLACRIEGVVCFPPSWNLSSVQREFESAFRTAVSDFAGHEPVQASLEWGDYIAEACASQADSRLVRLAGNVILAATGEAPKPTYAYSASDIRYPLLHWGGQAIGIGPRCGALGERDEWIDRREYIQTIATLTAMIEEILGGR